MKGPSFFQFAVIGICVALLVIGVLIFAVLGGAFGGSSATGQVVLWGTLDGSKMETVLESLRQSDKTFQDVSYAQKNPDTYTGDLVNAIASGQSPDLFLLSQDQVLSFKDKVTLIPWANYSQSDFQSAFIDESNLFLTVNGALALPVLTDPLVMYSNRDSFATAGLAQIPQYWTDVLADVSSLTTRDGAGNITKSGVALGTWNNIPNAKPVLAALLLQAGDKIVLQNADGSVTPQLGVQGNLSENPASSALQFYTQFADPSKTSYSWNRSQPSASESFSAGDSAMYFGFASEYQTLLARNPNLHIDVSALPQAHGSAQQVTFGRITGVTISRAAKNPTGALKVAQALSEAPVEALIATAFGLPPVRRDLLSQNSADATATVFARSALIAHGFLDPNPEKSASVFQTMVESVLSGKSVPADSVATAAQSFAALFPR